MAITRTAVQSPAVLLASATLRKRTDAYASANGIAPSARSLSAGETNTVLPKWNENALNMDLALLYGGGSIHCVCKGLDITTASVGAVSVAAGHAIIEGLCEVATAQTPIALTANVWNYLYAVQFVGSPAQIQVIPNSLVPPSGGLGQVFIGAVLTNSGNVVQTIDTSGVLYERGGGLRFRQTADAGQPADTPPANVVFLTKTLGGIYLWDGTNYQLAGVTGAAFYWGTSARSNVDPTLHDNYQPAGGRHFTDADRTILTDANVRDAAGHWGANAFASVKAQFASLWSYLDNLLFVRTADPSAQPDGKVLQTSGGAAVWGTAPSTPPTAHASTHATGGSDPLTPAAIGAAAAMHASAHAAGGTDQVTPAAIGAAPAVHTHDDRYYTEAEVASLLTGKSDVGHLHDASAVTTGVFDDARLPVATTSDNGIVQLAGHSSTTPGLAVQADDPRLVPGGVSADDMGREVVRGMSRRVPGDGTNTSTGPDWQVYKGVTFVSSGSFGATGTGGWKVSKPTAGIHIITVPTGAVDGDDYAVWDIDGQSTTFKVRGQIESVTADAGASTKGLTKLSVAPVSGSNPIAVGDNDTRLQNATKLQGNDVSASAPSTGNFFRWGGSSWAPSAIGASDLPGATTGAQGAVKLAQDLAGSAALPTVAGLQGRAVYNGAPSDGQVLAWSAANSRWQPTTPSGGGGGGGVSLGGDLGGSTSSPTVIGIQTTPVSTTPPNHRQVMRAYDDGISGVIWQAEDLTINGDTHVLSGSTGADYSVPDNVNLILVDGSTLGTSQFFRVELPNAGSAEDGREITVIRLDNGTDLIKNVFVQPDGGFIMPDGIGLQRGDVDEANTGSGTIPLWGAGTSIRLRADQANSRWVVVAAVVVDHPYNRKPRGAMYVDPTTRTGNFTIPRASYHVRVSPTSTGHVDITLPNSTLCIGEDVTVFGFGADISGTHYIDVLPASGQAVNCPSGYNRLTMAGDSVTFRSVGSAGWDYVA